MNKNLMAAIAVIALILIGIIVYAILKPPKIYFSEDPKTWVEKKDITTKTVNVEKVTQGQAYDHVSDLYLSINGTTTAFLYEGFYDGEYFKKEYFKDGKAVMRVGPDMEPNDGVIEGIVTERVNNGKYEVHIFLDEDWKKQIPDTNIIWGRFNDRVKPFEFNEVSSGIYMDQIEDDPARFDYNHMQSYSAIIVGRITPEQVKTGDTTGATVIMFQ